MYACNALHESIISSGCAACPEEETTYLALPSDVIVLPVDDGGSVEGSVL
jgi:hypothetical protein